MWEHSLVTEHEQVYHAATWRQAASLSLTPRRLRGAKKPCPATGKKEPDPVLFCQLKPVKPARPISGDVPGMGALGSLKRLGLITCLALPHAINDAHPNVSQSPDSHAVAFPLCAFALIVRACPGFLPCALPSKLIERVAQRLHTGKAFVGFGVIAALKGHRRCASQGLYTAGIGIAAAVLAPLSKYARSQPLACTGQARKDGLVLMSQKKGLDLFLVSRNVLDHHQQLLHQREQQAR